MPRPNNEMDFEKEMSKDPTHKWSAAADQTTAWIKSKEQLTLSDYIDAIGGDECKATASDRQEAADETIKARGTKYGRFTHNSEVIQKLKAVAKSGLCQHEERPIMKPYQLEALDMILHKIGRIVCGDPNYADSWHDIAGYALLVEKILNGENP